MQVCLVILHSIARLWLVACTMPPLIQSKDLISLSKVFRQRPPLAGVPGGSMQTNYDILIGLAPHLVMKIQISDPDAQILQDFAPPPQVCVPPLLRDCAAMLNLCVMSF